MGKAAFRRVDVARLVAGAIAGGWPVGSFKVSVENGCPTLLPVVRIEPLSEAADLERRMQEAFGS